MCAGQLHCSRFRSAGRSSGSHTVAQEDSVPACLPGQARRGLRFCGSQGSRTPFQVLTCVSQFLDILLLKSCEVLSLLALGGHVPSSCWIVLCWDVSPVLNTGIGIHAYYAR